MIIEELRELATKQVELGAALSHFADVWESERAQQTLRLDWQPIETLPKDGTKFLLRSVSEQIDVGYHNGFYLFNNLGWDCRITWTKWAPLNI